MWSGFYAGPIGMHYKHALATKGPKHIQIMESNLMKFKINRTYLHLGLNFINFKLNSYSHAFF